MLRVRDTGIGIAPEALSQIWDMFVQADRRMKGAQGGMGIGLTLVKSLVEMHGDGLRSPARAWAKAVNSWRFAAH